MSELVDLRARQAATEAARRVRRVAHRVSMADIAFTPPTPAEMDQSHAAIHHHPRGLCPRCGDFEQLTLI